MLVNSTSRVTQERRKWEWPLKLASLRVQLSSDRRLLLAALAKQWGEQGELGEGRHPKVHQTNDFLFPGPGLRLTVDRVAY